MLAAAALTFVLSSIPVVGDTACPSPALVMDGMRSLGLSAGAARCAASLKQVRGGVVLELKDGEGHRVAQRSIPVEGSCREMAQSAALVLSVWCQALEAQNLPRPRVLEMPVPLSPTEPRRTRVWGGVGLVASQAGNFRGGLEGLVWVHPAGRALFVAMALSAEFPHALTLGPGTVQWSRTAVSGGVGLDLVDSPVQLGLSASAVAALVRASGTGFDVNHAATGFSPGAELRGQISRHFGGWAAWVAVESRYWFAPAHVAVVGLPGQSDLPPLESRLSLGVGLEVR